MLYYQLADSFNELDTIAAIVEKISVQGPSALTDNDHSSMVGELERIKSQARADIKIFGLNAWVYINSNLMMINRLVLKLLERVKSVSDLELVASGRSAIYDFCLQMKDHLDELYHFFEKLGEGYDLII